MSFRFTNNLISTMKQKALMFSYQKQLYNRKFTGYCDGLTVILNSSGEVLSMSISEEMKSKFYFPVSEENINNNNNLNNNNNNNNPVDPEKLSLAIKTAIWDGNNKIKTAKEEYYNKSIINSERIGNNINNNRALEGQGATSIGRYHKWFDESSATIGPHIYESIKDRYRYFNNNNNNLNNNNNNILFSNANPSTIKDGNTDISLLEIFPEYAGHLAVSDLSALNLNNLNNNNNNLNNNNNINRVTHGKTEAAQETGKDELLYWTRVEAIRRAQLATIGNIPRREYTDTSGRVPKDNFEERVKLEFVR